MTKNKDRILIVDDSADTRQIIQRNLTEQGYKVFTTADVPNAIQILSSIRIDLVITDLKMPGINGIELIKHVRQNNKDSEIIMITGYPTIESAVEAVKIGALDYLTKPFTEQELLKTVKKALDKLKYTRKMKSQSKSDFGKHYGIIGQSDVMKKVYNETLKASQTSSTVLIYGESGTGKELIARALHYNSSRSSSPFIPINCGAIPESLLESELFGYVKGAFTGAYENREGLFLTADKGSVFLDEISETSLAMQVKLLRILENKEIYMVGSKHPKNADVRVICATNKNLFNLVEKDQFREDLFYRLNVIRIDLPPLRERGDDVILLTNYFTKKYAEKLGKDIPEYTAKALETLQEYHWPGNVRELENIVHRVVLMNDNDKIDIADLPPLMRFTALKQSGLNRTLNDVELEYIKNVLVSVDNNKTKAAQILGIDRKTLRQKLKKAGLNDS
ncbi:MAG: sigma-54 dependent transcriptional regulator [Candidatus Cloacimonetes bacterium]|nr:sigma-54 dependent transcriptional regulator [Candidatus Cloacimonadota bacterium]MCF7884829.1 sigma-54 dependent transcriptional regulator [Candidatus Cloacimonadota bacterium]